MAARREARSARALPGQRQGGTGLDGALMGRQRRWGALVWAARVAQWMRRAAASERERAGRVRSRQRRRSAPGSEGWSLWGARDGCQSVGCRAALLIEC